MKRIIVCCRELFLDGIRHILFKIETKFAKEKTNDE